MKKIQIFEPAMCCSTGLCGVSINQELLRISTVINTLNKKGIKVERYNLNSAPIEFINNQVISQFIRDKGVEHLPIILLDGEIVISGRYPSNEEFCTMLELPEQFFRISARRGRLI